MAVSWFLEEIAMANTKVVRRINTDKGWGHYRAAYAANARVKPGIVIVAGREVKHTTRYFELRYYDGAEPVYEALQGASETRRLL